MGYVCNICKYLTMCEAKLDVTSFFGFLVRHDVTKKIAISFLIFSLFLKSGPPLSSHDPQPFFWLCNCFLILNSHIPGVPRKKRKKTPTLSRAALQSLPHLLKWPDL